MKTSIFIPDDIYEGLKIEVEAGRFTSISESIRFYLRFGRGIVNLKRLLSSLPQQNINDLITGLEKMKDLGKETLDWNFLIEHNLHMPKEEEIYDQQKR